MKRTLVISNACFSDSISNGRTLSGLFEKGEKEKLAQFFVYGEPESRVCDNYYRVSDKDAFHSLIPFKTYGGIVKCEDHPQHQTGNVSSVTGRKTPFKMLMRELVWKFGGWKNKYLWDWIDQFKPEIIFLFLANNTFLIRLSICVAKRYQIPVIVYTTEGYCFMRYNYLTYRPSITYKIYYKWLCYMYKKIVPYVEQGFFNSTLLRDEYKKKFNFPCQCIMNGSKVNYINNAALNREKPVMVSYLGNLGLGRHKALVEIAQTLKEINSEYYLDVYGASPNQTVADALEGCENLRYHGFVSYDDVIKIIHESSLLVHTERIDSIMNRELKYAFSTKIADSVSSGTPLILYAYEGLAETIFLKENDCAFIAHNKEMLKTVLTQALTDETRRQEIVENARRVKEEYLSGNNCFISAFM